MSGILNKILKADDQKKKTDSVKEVKTDKKETVKVKDTQKSVATATPVTKAPIKVASTPVKEVAKPIKVQRKDDAGAYKILLQPLVTEKATDLMQYNKYCFLVALTANKSEVAKTIMNVYGVKPAKVNFIKKQGKRVRYGRIFGKTKRTKKAIITLRPGDKMEIYEGV